MVKKQPLHREAVKKNECFLSTPGDAADTRFHRRGRWGRKGVGCKERQMGEESKNQCFFIKSRRYTAADGGGDEWVVKKGGVAKVRIDLRHTAGK